MSVIISIVLILVSLVLIVAVLMQEGNKQGLGAISGAACEALKGWNGPDEAVSGASKTYVELYFQQGL